MLRPSSTFPSIAAALHLCLPECPSIWKEAGKRLPASADDAKSPPDDAAARAAAVAKMGA